MQQANSTDGLTSATDVAPACSMESVLFALLQMLFMCGFHLRSEVMVTP